MLPPSSPYVVRERVWSLWRVAWIVLLLVLFGGIAARFAADNEIQPLGLGIVVAFLLGLFVLMLPRRQVLLRVGPEGISLKRSTGRLATGARSRHIPWSSVAQVVWWLTSAMGGRSGSACGCGRVRPCPGVCAR
jgi:hypothetical protein